MKDQKLLDQTTPGERLRIKNTDSEHIDISGQTAHENKHRRREINENIVSSNSHNQGAFMK